MADVKLTPMKVSKDFPLDNMFMTFKFEDEGMSFGYIIGQKAFWTFIGSNQPSGTRLVEEEVEFPWYLMGGATRRALVHYVNNKKFAAYVPVFPTKDEVEKYSASFRR